VPRDGGGGPESGVRAYGAATALLAVVFIGIGIALVVETALAGGGIGFLFGALFIAAGAGRLYLLRRRRAA
jgi:hypothetical protein